MVLSNQFKVWTVGSAVVCGVRYHVRYHCREGIWDENKVDDLPVLSIKYSSTSEDSSATGVEHDGAAATSSTGKFYCYQCLYRILLL